MIQALQTRHVAQCLLIVFSLAGSTLGALSQTIAPGLTSPDLWKSEHVPFSFIYGGKPSAQLLAGWHISHEVIANRRGELHRTTYTDPATHLKVMADVRLYPEFPDVVDWVIRFRNEGSSDTSIIENILPLDYSIPAVTGESVLRHARGAMRLLQISNRSRKISAPAEATISNRSAAILPTRIRFLFLICKTVTRA